MTSAIVYRSRDPEVLRRWRDIGEAIARYVAKTDGILAAAGAGGYTVVRETGCFPGRVAGLDIAPGEQLPPGWRLNGRHAVPDTRRAAGRWITAALEDLEHPGDPRRALTGIPAAARGPGEPGGCRVELLEDGKALYVSWAAAAGDAARLAPIGAGIDVSLWERVPPHQAAQPSMLAGLWWLVADPGPLYGGEFLPRPPGVRAARADAAALQSEAAGHGHRRYRDNREPSTRRPAIGCRGHCWCGELLGHEWPGKAAGAAHPRPARPSGPGGRPSGPAGVAHTGPGGAMDERPGREGQPGTDQLPRAAGVRSSR